ncbi:hypothetical protein OROGR_018471 [Orobanche gracilis]
MSWQTYVDDHLMRDEDDHNLTSATILGRQRLGQEQPLPSVLTPEELTAIMNDFECPVSLTPTGLGNQVHGDSR